MKKLYTLALVALSAASAFAAPTLPTLEEVMENQSNAGRIALKHTLESKRIVASNEALTTRKAKKAAKAAAFASAAELAGTYYSQDYGNFTTTKGGWESTGFMKITASNDNKISINDFFYPGYSVEGSYNPATGTITVPAAQLGTYNITDSTGTVLGTAPITGGIVDLNTGAINDFEFTVNTENHSFSWEASSTLNPEDGKYYLDNILAFFNSNDFDFKNGMLGYTELAENYGVNTVGQYQSVNAEGTALLDPVKFYSYVDLAKDEDGKDAIRMTGFPPKTVFSKVALNFFPNAVYFTLSEDKTKATASYQELFPGSGIDFYLWGTTEGADGKLVWNEEPIEEFEIVTDQDDQILYNFFCSMATFPDASGKSYKAACYEFMLLLPFNLSNSGVSNVTVDANGPAEYFNLEGVRVANPENGIFIRRQGGKATKVVM